MPVSAVSRRHDAVKKVNAARNALDYISRSSHAHEISGLVLRHIFLNGLDSIVHFLMSLADGQTSDRITRKFKLGDFLHVLYTNIREGGALVYSEQHLSGIYCILAAVIFRERGFASDEPTIGTVAGFLNIFARRWDLYAFIECHCNIRSEVCLNAHALLRSHEYMPAVNVRIELNALFAYFAQTCERKNLKSAAVGQDRAIPGHEFVQSAHISHQLVTWAEMKMICV